MHAWPALPVPTRSLDVPGFSLAHASDTDGKTGVTLLLCPEGALAAAEVRGSATGTRQFDSLVAVEHVASRAHALVLAGGSGFGLDAAGAVAVELAAQGYGFQTGYRPVPLVPTAILFDLAFGSADAAPTPEMMRAALHAAQQRQGQAVEVEVGSVGAGTGASVGKALGPVQGMKGGFGFASLKVPGGPTVAAAVALNAFGDVRDPDSGRLLAGCRRSPDSLELAGAERVLANLPPEHQTVWEGNTTLAAVITDAALPKPGLLKVCHMAFGGFHRALAPALTLYDGDLIAVLSSGTQPAHVNQVGVLAEHAVAAAIVTAVQSADGFGILPTAADLGAL